MMLYIAKVYSASPKLFQPCKVLGCCCFGCRRNAHKRKAGCRHVLTHGQGLNANEHLSNQGLKYKQTLAFLKVENITKVGI